MSETALLDPILYPLLGPKGYVEPEAIGRIMDLKSSAPRLRIVRNGSVQAERYTTGPIIDPVTRVELVGETLPSPLIFRISGGPATGSRGS